MQAVDVWKIVFDITEQQNSKAYLLISGQLSTLHEELEMVRLGMEKNDFSAHLYSRMLSAIEKGISVEILHANWQSAAQYFKPEFMCALDFCSEILPDEAQQLSDSDIDELQRLLEELKQELDVKNLPDSLDRLIRKHISIIEKAVHDYKIQGYRAVEQAVSSIVGDITIEEKIFRDSVNDSSLISKVGGVYTKFMEPVLGKINPVLGIVNSVLGISQHVS